MPLPTKPVMTPPPAQTPDKYGSDPVAFDAAMQAFLDWIASHWKVDQSAALDYVQVGVDDVQTNATSAANSASSASNSASSAAASSTSATASATSALASKNAAATSETNAASSAGSAADSAAAANNYANAASASAASALASKTAAAGSEVNAATSATNSAVSAASASGFANAASTSANAAAASANAIGVTANVAAWVSGTSYPAGTVVYSPSTFVTYRRKTTGAGTTDPSLDTTNWEQLTVNQQYVDSLVATVEYALSGLQMAQERIDRLRYGPWSQSGTVTLQNKGVVSGATVSKSTTVTRALDIAAGVVFANGRSYSLAQASAAATVPENSGASASTAYAYLQLVSGAWVLAVTPLGGIVPVGGITLYRITVPANNTAATDQYLASCTLTDRRRIEAAFPVLFNSPTALAIAFARPMQSADYRVHLDVVSATGAPTHNSAVQIGSRATNGMTLTLSSAADNVTVNWVAERPLD